MLRIILPRRPLRRVVPTLALRVRNERDALIGAGLATAMSAAGAHLVLDESVVWGRLSQEATSLQVGILRQDRHGSRAEGILTALQFPEHSTLLQDAAMESALFPLRFSEDYDLRDPDGMDCVSCRGDHLLHRRGHLSWILGRAGHLEDGQCWERMAMSAIALSLGANQEAVRKGLAQMIEISAKVEVV